MLPPATSAAGATKHAYVGSYTGFTEKGTLGWVGTANPGVGITIFNFDECASPSLPALPPAPLPRAPPAYPGARLRRASGKLTPTGEVVPHKGLGDGDSPAWLEVDPTGEYLIATHELSHHTGVDKGVGFLSAPAHPPASVRCCCCLAQLGWACGAGRATRSIRRAAR